MHRAGFDVAQALILPTRWTTREPQGLRGRAGPGRRYFARVQPEALARFAEQHALRHLPARAVEDEFVFQNSFRLNQRYLREPRRQARVRREPRPRPARPQDRRLRRAGGRAYYRLEDLGPRLDRPPALPDQGPGLAPRRRPPVHRHERGAGPQRRLRQLPPSIRVPARSATSCRCSSPTPRCASSCSTCGTASTAIRSRYVHRGAGAHQRARLRPAARGEAALYRACCRRTHSRVARTAPGSSSSPAASPTRGLASSIGITDTSMLRPQVFALQQGEPSVGLSRLGETGHRRGARKPRRAAADVRSQSRSLLERPGRQPHRRRRLPLPRRARRDADRASGAPTSSADSSRPTGAGWAQRRGPPTINPEAAETVMRGAWRSATARQMRWPTRPPATCRLGATAGSSVSLPRSVPMPPTTRVASARSPFCRGSWIAASNWRP